MKSIDNGIAIFRDISVHLTGFTSMELTGTGMLETYYHVMVNKNNLGVVEDFLAAAAKILAENSKNPANLKSEILNNLMPDSMYSGLAQNIITMWYLGSWVNEIISPQSYVQGMIWSVANAHPPGAKQPGFASWNIAPTEL